MPVPTTGGGPVTGLLLAPHFAPALDRVPPNPVARPARRPAPDPPADFSAATGTPAVPDLELVRIPSNPVARPVARPGPDLPADFSAVTIPPSVRNTSSGGLSASTAITLPASNSGDQVAVMVAGTASLPAATAGWTRQWNTPTGSGGAPYLALYTCTSDGAPSTPLSANVTGGWIAWSVQDTSGVDVTLSAADGGVTQPIVAPSVTATVEHTLLLNGYVGYKAASSPTITLPASQTGTDVGPVTITNGELLGGSEEVAASGATGTRSASVSTTVRWVGGSVAYKP